MTQTISGKVMCEDCGGQTISNNPFALKSFIGQHLMNGKCVRFVVFTCKA